MASCKPFSVDLGAGSERPAALRAAALPGRLSDRHRCRLLCRPDLGRQDRRARWRRSPPPIRCRRFAAASATRRANRPAAAPTPMARSRSARSSARCSTRWARPISLPPVAADKSKRVAIVGAGPAGLTAAQDIALAGYRVDLYEAQSRPGGMALWGIPDFRLPARVVEEDIGAHSRTLPGHHTASERAARRGRDARRPAPRP